VASEVLCGKKCLALLNTATDGGGDILVMNDHWLSELVRRWYTRAVRKASSHFEYLDNRTSGLDV